MKAGAVVRPPGDKSITHRALMLAALAPGASELRGALAAEDIRATARVLRLLGAEVGPLRRDGTVRVRGGRWHRPPRPLHCGNSGTTARLLLGLLAGHAFAARLTGDASLRRRPMRRVTDPLRRMGARIMEERGDGLPLVIEGGPLQALAYDAPVASAQVKSALLFAGLVGGSEVVLREPQRSRDHTERLLAHLGLAIHVDGTTVRLASGPRSVPPFALQIPGDPSAAAFLVAAALLARGGELRLEGVGMNPTRVGFLTVLERMGAAVTREDERQVGAEPVADLVVRPAPLAATEIAPGEVPSLIDEVPVLAVVASRARGETRFRSVGELRVKESDRLALLARNLRAVGASAGVEGDDLVVRGAEDGWRPAGPVETAGDHRLAMAFAVLGTVPGARVALSETASARISFPAFFAELERVARP